MPPHGSAASFWMQQLSQVEYETVIVDVGQAGAEKFKLMRASLLSALHLRKPAPDMELLEYMVRPDQVWATLREVFPAEYKRQTERWRTLELRVMNGEMEPPSAPPAPPPLPDQLPGIVPEGAGVNEGKKPVVQKVAERNAFDVLRGEAAVPSIQHRPRGS